MLTRSPTHLKGGITSFVTKLVVKQTKKGLEDSQYVESLAQVTARSQIHIGKGFSATLEEVKNDITALFKSKTATNAPMQVEGNDRNDVSKSTPKR